MAKHIAFGEAVNEAERWAFQLLTEELPSDYLLLTNIEIPTPSGQSLEVDALVVGQWAIYVVDVKGYTGQLAAGQYAWSLNDRQVDNSLAKANYVARVLVGQLKNKIPVGVYAPWCQGMVFATGRRGTDIEITKPQNNFGVYGPENFISALTQDWAITSLHKHPLTEVQRQHVVDTLGQVSVVERQNNHIQDFEKTHCLFKHQGLAIWQANYTSADWGASWLLKILTPSEFDTQLEYQQQNQLFNEEITRLQQLAGCSGVPYCAPLIQNGEQSVLPIRMPRGEPIEQVNIALLSPQALLATLRSAATALQQIHRRGFAVSHWGEHSVFVSVDAEVEFINITNQCDVKDDIVRFAECFTAFAECLPDARILFWFNQAKLAQTTNLDELRAILSTVLASDLLIANTAKQAEIIEVGSLIDRFYQLESNIAKSESSEVWQARHVLGNYTCSLSIYHHASQQWPQLSNIYTSLMNMYHPNVQQVIQFGKMAAKDTVYLTAQWVEGKALQDWREDIVIGQGVVGNWFKQLLTALQYLHRFDIHHGAICPQNIMVNQEQAVLINFGSGLDLAATRYAEQYADPNLWAMEGGAERDLYGLVASFVDVLSPKGLKPNLTHEELLNTLEEFDLSVFPRGLFEICKKILTFELVIDANTDYLLLFELIDEVIVGHK